jgi:hypothetical protein
MKLVNISKWTKAYDLRGNIQYVRTITEQTKKGAIYTRCEAVRQKLSA